MEEMFESGFSLYQKIINLFKEKGLILDFKFEFNLSRASPRSNEIVLCTIQISPTGHGLRRMYIFTITPIYIGVVVKHVIGDGGYKTLSKLSFITDNVSDYDHILKRVSEAL